MSEFPPISNPSPETYGRSAYWALSFFVQLGIGNAHNTASYIQKAVAFSLGSEIDPMAEIDTDKNGHDRILIGFTLQERQTLERALGVGVTAVRTALETAGLGMHATTSVVTLEYQDQAGGSVGYYDITQKAMEIEMAIQQFGDLDSESFNT